MRRHTLWVAIALITLISFITSRNAWAGSAGAGDHNPAMAAASYLEVFYLTQAATITTFNVDPSSGTATQAGSPLTLPGGLLIGQITPFPNGHYLYILWTDSTFNAQFSVYATDASGVPGGAAVQTMAAINWQFLLHPSGKFAYVLRTYSNQSGTSSALELYQVDANTGKLILPAQILHRFGPDSTHFESLYGVSRDGTRLYDVWSLSLGSKNNATYSSQLIDLKTGTLSHNTKLLYTSNFGGIDVVKIATHAVLDLHNDSSNPQNEVLNVYPNTQNPSAPKLVCTGQMLSACQNSSNLFVDPAERYLFLSDSVAKQLVVAKLDKTTKRFVQADSIAGNPWIIFSPDDALAYALGFNNGNAVLDIYKFDKTTGILTLGQELSPATPYWVYTAERK